MGALPAQALTSRNESSSDGAIGQAQIEQHSVEAIAAQAIQRVGELIHVHDAGGAPVAPLAVLFDLEQGFAQELFIFEIVLHQQELQGF